MKKNVLLKLSGASLKNESNVICDEKLNRIALEISKITNDYNVGVVIGGGNIWRGNIAEKINMNRSIADDMGMLATLINSIALKSALTKFNINAQVYNAFSLPRMAKEHVAEDFNNDLKEGKVVIFSGGTGMPFFSTDTAAALCASEINASYILMGKNNIDGLYDKDPNKFDDAKFIDEISFDEVIQKKLEVADSTSMTMCEQNNINIIIFDIDKENSIQNALNMNGKFSLVYKNKEDIYNNELDLVSNNENDTEINNDEVDSCVSNDNQEEIEKRLEKILKRNKEELEKIKNIK